MAKAPTDTIEVEDEFSQYQLPDEPQTPPSNIQPSANGSVLGNGDFSSPNFVAGQVGWRMDSEGNFEAVNATFSGAISGLSLNIPDATTTSSFHVDAAGNTWWGANVASGYTNATAYILATGAAHFENIEIGGTTIQYVITNSGIFSFGDGSDGVATLDGSTAVAGMTRSGNDYTMTRDVYFSTLTINNSCTLNPAGYRIFVSNLLTVGQGTSGKIFRDGNAGSNGTNGGGGGVQTPTSPGGAALADGYLKGALAGATGGGSGAAAAYTAQSGAAGVATQNSLGTSGVSGGTGGNGRNSIGGTNAGAGPNGPGTATVSNVKLIANWHLATLLDIILVDGSPTLYKPGQTIRFDNSGSSTGGGCGGAGQPSNGGPSGGGGAGGGAGSSGGIVAIYARTIVMNAGASITANGGAGGRGGDGAPGSGDAFGGGSGGGGGGGGGNGGIIILVYNLLTNAGSITASGGSGGGIGIGGSAPASGRPGTDGTAGSPGSSGTIYQFQLSL